MDWLRRFPISICSLVLYLATCVAGVGLHHHAHEHGQATGEPGLSQQLVLSPAPASSDDHEEDCAICHALHLAQAPVTVARFEVLQLPVGEAALPGIVQRPLRTL